jgi:hypothetical protein
VDDEFYALSRQFARAANQGTNVVRDLSALPLPELEAEDTGWFQPSEDRKNEPAEAEPVPVPPRPAPRTQFPQRHARPEPPPRVEPPPEPAPPEPTPIFEAIESEWFRRREQARAAAEASRQAPLRPEPSPGPAAPAPMPQRQPSAPAAPYAAPFPAQQPAPAPPSPSQAPAAAQPAPASAAPADWSSPADEGWRAARALANPAQDGVTQAGLPRRTPRANLVPGRAGGTGAARAVPPHNLRRDSSPGGRP